MASLLVYYPFIEEGLKVIVIIWAIVSFLVIGKGRPKTKHTLVTFVGLGLLLFSVVLDFTDEFEVLDKVFIIGRSYPWHDVCEDLIGFTLGFALFVWAAIAHARGNE